MPNKKTSKRQWRDGASAAPPFTAASIPVRASTADTGIRIMGAPARTSSGSATS